MYIPRVNVHSVAPATQNVVGMWGSDVHLRLMLLTLLLLRHVVFDDGGEALLVVMPTTLVSVRGGTY